MRWLAAALLLAGCDSLLGEKTTYCPDTGAICPSGLVCAGDVTLCGTPDDVGVCRGVDELAECSSSAAPHGYCTSVICTPCDPNYSWCHYSGWSQMTYQGPDLYSIWPVAKNDVYVSGDPGAVYHYDGSAWTALASEGGDRLISMFVASATDIYALDNGVLVHHFDGTTWTSTSQTFLNALWGSGPNDVYAVGLNGGVRHFDGASWSPQTSGSNKNLLAMWGADAGHLFVAGTYTILTSTGNGTWTTSLSDTAAKFVAIWGTTASDVYAAANCEAGMCTGSFVRHFNGASWDPASPVPIAATAQLTGLWIGSGGAPLVTASDGTIFRLAAGAWSQESLANTNTLTAIRGTATDDVFAVGMPGTIWHYEGM